MSTQTSLSEALPPAVNRPTTRYDSFGPIRRVSPSPVPLNRRARLRLTIASPLPASKFRPWTIVKAGRSFSATGVSPGFGEASTPRMIRFARPPRTRSTTGICRSSPDARGWRLSSCAIPPRFLILSDESRTIPLTVSEVDPFRMTIRSRGSPESFMLCSSPSTRLKSPQEDQTMRPVPRTVIIVLTHRTRRFRTLYLIGTIGGQTTFLRPLTTESREAWMAGNSPLKAPMPSATTSPPRAVGHGM